MKWRYRALLVGNWHFPGDPTNLPNLNGPIQDVASLATALTDSKTGLFHDSDVEVVTERTATEIAVAAEHFFSVAGRNELLFLYYSGHGLTNDRGDELLLCGRDSRT